jgi:hypothetical protein
MSKRTKKESLLATLNEVFGPTTMLPSYSPMEAAQFISASDDAPETPPGSAQLPRCQDTGKVCYPSKKIASEVTRRVQKKRNTFLRVYFCDHCKHHHLTSKKP